MWKVRDNDKNLNTFPLLPLFPAQLHSFTPDSSTLALGPRAWETEIVVSP